MTVDGMNAAEKGTTTACLPEETHIVTATIADEDAAAATVAAVAEAGAKTGLETGIESGTESATGTAHEAGPTAGVDPGAGAETEILERVAQKELMFTHLLQLRLPRQQPSSLSHL